MNPLAAYGWDDRVEAQFASVADGSLRPGRVRRVERSVRTATGVGPSAIVALGDDEDVLATASEPLAVGDWVAVRIVRADEPAVIEHVLPRWSTLSRLDTATSQQQLLATNIDVVLILAPLDRLRVSRIERELLVAWESGATPVVVLTKADLARDPDRQAHRLRDRLSGTDVIVTSAATGVGVDAIARVLQPNRTAVLFGPSGAGKSSLANALLGDDVMETQEVRAGDQRGRHTTTSRHLLPLGRGGVLIDTPGLRGVGVWGGEEGLSVAFADVEQHIGQCRFRDCRHDREPGCAVLAAVEAGELTPERVANYRKLLEEVRPGDRRRPSR